MLDGKEAIETGSFHCGVGHLLLSLLSGGLVFPLHVVPGVTSEF